MRARLDRKERNGNIKAARGQLDGQAWGTLLLSPYSVTEAEHCSCHRIPSPRPPAGTRRRQTVQIIPSPYSLEITQFHSGTGTNASSASCRNGSRSIWLTSRTIISPCESPSAFQERILVLLISGYRVVLLSSSTNEKSLISTPAFLASISTVTALAKSRQESNSA